ncbi:hypothetical protein PR002_g10485 [Phytophthora rubi]|uniref:Uncharacterized protein n=1 Tax=Phytophthora rubi TaxID=129364 RepID=A0A6A3M7F2_9STRA|nr:hypothetical protein PR002_g10485 [Phytophthora rubi]
MCVLEKAGQAGGSCYNISEVNDQANEYRELIHQFPSFYDPNI